MADEKGAGGAEDRQRDDVAPPDEAEEIAGDADARRLEITPERPEPRPPS